MHLLGLEMSLDINHTWIGNRNWEELSLTCILLNGSLVFLNIGGLLAVIGSLNLFANNWFLLGSLTLLLEQNFITSS